MNRPDAVYEARLARAFREMEGPVEDLRRATIVMETVHSDAMVPCKLIKVPNPTYRGFLLTDDQEAGLAYAVTHVGDLARDLVKTWEAFVTDARREQEEQEARETFSSELRETPVEGADLLDLEEPLRTAIGMAKALRLMAVNPISDGIDAEPVFVLGRDLEAALTTLESQWTALVEATGRPAGCDDVALDCYAVADECMAECRRPGESEMKTGLI